MPHSSGGGSHGGGSHGGGSHGSHGGSSGTRISNHYFYGARCYRRHYRYGNRADEYIYANRKPGKTTLGGTVVICLMAVFFLFMGFSSIAQDMPKKLKPVYIDKPAVHDEFELIDNDDELVNTLKNYQDVTGICPVIYTTFDEIWNNQYADLESYAYEMYVDNFTDEQHFVIVYSVPMEQAIALNNGTITVPDYSWEAIQGDDTDPIITTTLFRVFADRVQDKLESGANPGEAFNFAFTKATNDAESMVKPGGGSWMLKMGSSLMPILIIAGIFIPMIIFSIKNYLKFRGAEYEEVPIDHDPESGARYVSVTESHMTGSAANAQGVPMGAYAGSSSSDGDQSTQTISDLQKGGTIVGSILGFVFLTPFYIAGIGMIIGGIVMISKGQGPEFGYYLLGFGVVWSGILVATTIGLTRNLTKLKKKDAPEKVSYPTTEYAQPVYSQPETQTQPQTPVQEQPEFDQQFFSQQKSNYEEDDEDYKRMKRRGFE